MEALLYFSRLKSGTVLCSAWLRVCKWAESSDPAGVTEQPVPEEPFALHPFWSGQLLRLLDVNMLGFRDPS